MRKTFVSSLFSLLLALPPAARAATISAEATDNATVQPAGPRAGASGKNFYNMEGSTAGGASFQSFAVADFTFLGSPGVASVSNVSLQMTQSNAAFSHAGPMSFYLTTNTASNIIQPGDPAQVKYVDPTFNGAAAVDLALKPLTLVGTGTFTVVATGTTDTFPLDPAILAPLLNVVKNGGTLRLVMTPDDAATAATYAGFSNATLPGPTLVYDTAVPEPACLTLMGLGVLGVLAARRRHTFCQTT